MLENGIREISGEVRNSLDFHRSQEGGGEVSHVVLSGAALDLPGFAEALQESARRRGRSASPSPGGRPSATSPRTAWRSPPGWPSRRCRGEGRQPDPRRRSAAAPARRRPLRGRRLRRARPARRARAASRCSTARPAMRSRARRAKVATLTAQAQAGPGAGRPAGALHELHRRCANSASQAVDSSSTRASTGPTPSTNSAACCPRHARSPRSPARSAATARPRRRRVGASASAAPRPRDDAPRAARAPRSVAQWPRPPRRAASPRSPSAAVPRASRGRADARPPAPDRRRQRSHAAELHQAASGAGGAAAGAAAAPATFAVQVTFDPLPAASATSSAEHEPGRDPGRRGRQQRGAHDIDWRRTMTGRDRIVIVVHRRAGRRCRRLAAASSRPSARRRRKLGAQVSAARRSSHRRRPGRTRSGAQASTRPRTPRS